MEKRKKKIKAISRKSTRRKRKIQNSLSANLSREKIILNTNKKKKLVKRLG
jgi:hypothetical protein